MAPTPTISLTTPVRRQDDGTTITVIPETTITYHTALSAGAIAGIVIGSIIGLLLLCLIVWWALRRNAGGDFKGTPPRHRRHRQAIRHRYHSSSPRPHSRHYSTHSHHHHGSRSRSRSVGHGHYRRSVEVVEAPHMAEPQRVYVEHGHPRYSSRGRQSWRE